MTRPKPDIHGLSPFQNAILAALAAYGPDKRIPAATLATDLKTTATACGKACRVLIDAGYVLRAVTETGITYRLMALPGGAPIPGATRAAPARSYKPAAMRPTQMKILATLIDRGPDGMTIADLSAALHIRPGPLSRAVAAVVRAGCASARTGHAHTIFVATRALDGAPLRWPAPGVTITVLPDGTRFHQCPTRPARGYGAFTTAATVIPGKPTL